MNRAIDGEPEEDITLGPSSFVAQIPNVPTGGGAVAPPVTHTSEADAEQIASDAGSRDVRGSSSGWTGVDPRDISLAHDVINWSDVPFRRQPPPRDSIDQDANAVEVGRPSRPFAVTVSSHADGERNIFMADGDFSSTHRHLADDGQPSQYKCYNACLMLCIIIRPYENYVC